MRPVASGGRETRQHGAGATASLWIDDEAGGRRIHDLEGPVTRIGRIGNNDIQILASHVSKYHAEVRRRENAFVIVDAGSKMGVFVNGTRVSETTLRDGDEITFGPYPPPLLVFRRRRPAAEARTDLSPAIGAMATVSTAGTRAGGSSLDRLARFLEVSRLMGGRVPVPVVLESVVDLAIEITGAERGFLVVQAADGTLEFPVTRDLAGRAAGDGSIHISRTIVQEVLSTGAPRLVTNVPDDEDLADLRSINQLDLRSVVALPMARIGPAGSDHPAGGPDAGGPVFGVLYCDSREARDVFNRIDRGMLETLARDASAAIENARLLRETEEKRRLEEELGLAREVQTTLLPRHFWADGHFEVEGRCIPSRHVGGDYFGQFRLPGGDCCFVMADVAGKGVPAALIAAAVQGALAAESATDQPPARMIERINRAICPLVPEGKFVTLFCARLAPSGLLTHVNAGHCPPIVCGRGGALRPLAAEGGMALGILPENVYPEQRATLAPGDVVVMYTDGITEAAGPGEPPDDASDGGFFGETRLEASVRAAAGLPAADLVAAILRDVRGFAGDGAPRDDMTVMVVRYLGRQPGGGGAS